MSKKSREAIRNNLAQALNPPAPTRKRSEHLDGLLDVYAPPQSEEISSIAIHSDTLQPLAEPILPIGLPESGLPESGRPDTNSLPTIVQPGYLKNSLPESGLPDSGKPDSGRPLINLMAGLPDVSGYTKLWHQMTDHLYSQLSTAEQAVHIQLFRLSWGYNKPTCFISLATLSRRVGIARSAVQRALAGLVEKGLVAKRQIVLGSGEQGVEYEVIPPPALLKSSGLPESGKPESGHIKENALKETNKREVAPLDIQNCPDCSGSGFYYPDGFEGGVAKCKHKKLMK